MDRFGYLFGKYGPQWMVDLWLRWRHGLPTFKPCVVEFNDIGATEILLRDCFTIWHPWGDKAHAVDLGYDEKGDLVGIRIWDRVQKSTG